MEVVIALIAGTTEDEAMHEEGYSPSDQPEPERPASVFAGVATAAESSSQVRWKQGSHLPLSFILQATDVDPPCANLTGRKDRVMGISK